MLPSGTSVRAVDTNVVARFLLDDDPHQSPIARGVIAGGVVIPVTVLVEVGWLLSSSYYRYPPGVVAEILSDFLDLPTVSVMQPDAVAWALGRAIAGGDLADMLHLVAASGADDFVTFDRGIAKAVGPAPLIPIETLV